MSTLHSVEFATAAGLLGQLVPLVRQVAVVAVEEVVITMTLGVLAVLWVVLQAFSVPMTGHVQCKIIFFYIYIDMVS